MRIQGPKTPDVTELRTARESGRPAPAQGAPDGEGAVVKLSDRGHDVAARSVEFERTQAERVSQIRAAVERGDYRIEFDRLAESILADELSRLPG